MPLAMMLAVASFATADTLRIGSFNLPYRFEDTNVTDIVHCVITNDVQAFCSQISAFRKPYQDDMGHTCVQRVNTPGTSLYRPQFFLDGIKFYIENGQTNCIIKQSLTDAAKAIESDLPTRTNLVAGAQAFIAGFVSGATTNLPIGEQRKLMRTIDSGCLKDIGADSSDAEVIEAQEEMRQGFAFLPICVLDTKYSYVGTNRVFWANVRTDMPQQPSYARSIEALPLVFADGRWSFLY